jgi:hypothetical protein
MHAVQSPAGFPQTTLPERHQGVELDIGSDADSFNSRTRASGIAISTAKIHASTGIYVIS